MSICVYDGYHDIIMRTQAEKVMGWEGGGYFIVITKK